MTPVLSAVAVGIVVGVATLASAHVHSARHPRTDPVAAGTVAVLTDPQASENSLTSAVHRHLASAGAEKDHAILAGVERLAPSDAGRADGIRMDFTGPRRSRFAIFVGHDVDPPTGTTFCPPIGGAELACTERAEAAGHLVDQVQVAQALPAAGPGAYRLVRDPSSLTPADHPDVRLTRESEVHRRDGTTTSVIEIVYGPTSLDPDEAFSETSTALDSAALDGQASWAALAGQGR